MDIISQVLLEQIAWNLTKQPGCALAFLASESQIYYAHAVYSSTGDTSPRSPTTVLIQGIYQHFPQHALKLLRNRIYCDYEPSEMCRGMIKVAAKRGGNKVNAQNHGLKTNFTFRSVVFESPEKKSSGEAFLLTPVEAMNRARTLAANIQRKSHLFESHRSIGAVLLSPEGQLLAEASNSNSSNKTLHAELNLLQTLFENASLGIKPRSVFYTTLKPCKMCASMILKCAEDPTQVKVVYETYDAGPMARQTVLNPGSAEWMRFFKGQKVPENNLEISFQEWAAAGFQN